MRKLQPRNPHPARFWTLGMATALTGHPTDGSSAPQVLVLGRKVRRAMREEAAAQNMPAPKPARTSRPACST